MTNPIQPKAPLGAQPAGAAAPASASQTRSGHLFEALLEDLERRADEVKHRGDAVRSSGELSQAVESARASLEDALSIKDRLLEAFRQAALSSSTPGSKPEAPQS